MDDGQSRVRLPRTQPYGRDELTQAVRLNDAMSDAVQDGVGGLCAQFNVSEDDLTYVARQRARMLGEVIGLPAEHRLVVAALPTAFTDGFFAALHMLEQG
jgi:hypothetical protein